MTKRLVEIDDALLERAKSIAGTDTIKDTINAALEPWGLVVAFVSVLN